MKVEPAIAPMLALAWALAACGTERVPDRGILSVEVRMTAERVGELWSSTGTDIDYPAEVWIGEEPFLASLNTAGETSLLEVKRNFTLELRSGTYRGARSVRLAASMADPSMLRPVLAFESFGRLGLPVPEVQFAALTINGRYEGLYHLIERVDEDFFARRHFPLRALYQGLGEAKFDQEMSENVARFYESRIEPENLAEVRRLAEFVTVASDTRFAAEIFQHVDREDAIRYVAGSLLTDNWDGFNKNVYLWSSGLGAPLRLVPWDLDRTYLNRPAPPGRIWLDNRLFERLYAVGGIRNEVMARVSQAFATDESVGAFRGRVQALEQQVARAYAEDPARGGLAGLRLEDAAAELVTQFERWKERVESPESGY